MCPRFDKRCKFWISSLTYHRCPRSLFQCSGFQVSVPCKIRALDLGSQASPLGSWVLGLRSHPSNESQVSSFGSHQKFRFLGPTFQICHLKGPSLLITFYWKTMIWKSHRKEIFDIFFNLKSGAGSQEPLYCICNNVLHMYNNP